MISIVIPTYSNLDGLKKCVESIVKYTDLSTVELIISANGGSEEMREYLYGETFGISGIPVRVFNVVWNDEPLGYSKACNAGIREAKGDIIVLLNDDTILLEQTKNQWIDYLIEPFKDPTVGITGPLQGPSEPAGHDFIIFFCVAIHRKVFDKIGLLDEEFGVGGGEDTAMCIEAERSGFKCVRVPAWDNPKFDQGFGVGVFPIYHVGEATVHKNPDWVHIFERNSQILRKRYNHQWNLGNNCERAVINATDDIKRYQKELIRYTWAASHIRKGEKILEIGCSSGYGTRILPDSADYTGIDYCADIIEYAKEQFPTKKFEQHDITTPEFEKWLEETGPYDTIVAFEVIEHIHTGREVAQMLKKHCKQLLMTTPFNETQGNWGIHHRIFNLKPEDFPGFEYLYITLDGQVSPYPERFDGANLLLMRSEQ